MIKFPPDRKDQQITPMQAKSWPGKTKNTIFGKGLALSAKANDLIRLLIFLGSQPG